MNFFTSKNLFSRASRKKCLIKLKNLRVPAMKQWHRPRKSAAVLVPMCEIEGLPSLLYTVRNYNEEVDGGLISFPGTKSWKNEQPVATALRGLEDDIGFTRCKVDIWGCAPAIPGRDGNVLITAVIAQLLKVKSSDFKVNEKKIAEAFAIPIHCLCDPRNQFHTQYQNGFIMPVFVVNTHKIWGITAYLTHLFLNAFLPRDVYNSSWLKQRIYLKE